MQHLSYRYRLYPTDEQMQLFVQAAGVARAIFNAGLEQRLMAYAMTGTSPLYVTQAKDLPELRKAFPWIGDVHSDIPQQALRDLDQAFQNFYKGRGGFPKFKKRGARDSFRLQQRIIKSKAANASRGGKAEHVSIEVRRLNRRWAQVRLPKIGWVRFRWTRHHQGRILRATIVRDGEHWYLSLGCRLDQPDAAPNGKPGVGVDRGVHVTATTSDGQMHYVPRPSARQRERLRRLERKLSRARRGSRRREELRSQIRRWHARFRRARTDFNHKLSSQLAKNHGLVAMENLSLGYMTRTAKGTIEAPGTGVARKASFNRAMREQAWGQLRWQLEYKAPLYGSELRLVPAKYTSQTCAECGHRDAGNRPPVSREFVCLSCGHEDHADVNAARNILAAATDPAGRQPVAARRALRSNVATKREPAELTAR